MEPVSINRIQTGVRMDRKLVKVLKALAEYFDVSLGEILELIVIGAFEGQVPFDQSTLSKIEKFKDVYEFRRSFVPLDGDRKE